MSRGLLLIDTLNLMHAANAGKPLHAGDLPTQAIYGFLRSLRLATKGFPQLTPICLHDGRSWRKATFSGYKASRDAEPRTASEKKLAALREQIAPQKPYVRKALQLLGVRQINTLNMEADDLAAIMVRKVRDTDRKVVLLSADKDWVQLIAPNVAWFDPIRDVRLTFNTLPKRLGYDLDKKRISAFQKDRTDDRFIGVPSPRAWLEMKALMGDKSDDIEGVGDIGERGALDFIRQFGSVAQFLCMSIDGSLPVLPKKFEAFALENSKQETYQTNMRLMDLNHPAIPRPLDLRVDDGSYDEKSFGDFCRELNFQSLMTDLSGWMEPFRRVK